MSTPSTGPQPPEEPRRSGEGRARLHEVALQPFAEHGVSGTSLQAIADAMGVTKAAVYYHYRTKDDLVLGVIAPTIDRLADVVASAQALRGRRARTEAALTGLVDVVVEARRHYYVLANDVTVQHVLAAHPTVKEKIGPLGELLSGPDPDEATTVAVTLFLSGFIGPLRDPACAGIAEDALRAHLLDAGRRLLLARRPAPR